MNRPLLGLVWLLGAMVTLATCSGTERVKGAVREARSARILFLRDDSLLVSGMTESGGRVWITDVHGQIQRQIVPAADDVMCPAISADGELLAVVAGGKGKRPALILLHSDGTVVREITDSPNTPLWPTFSAATNGLAYCSVSSDGTSTIYHYSIDTDSSEPLTDGKSADFMPRFTPDGSAIVFWRAARFGRTSFVVSKQWHDWALCKLDLATRVVTAIDQPRLYRIDWEPPSVGPSSVIFLGDQNVIWSTNLTDFNELTPIKYSSLDGTPGPLKSDTALISRVRYDQTTNRLFCSIALDDEFLVDEGDPAEVYELEMSSLGLRRLSNVNIPIADFAISRSGDKLAILSTTGKIHVIDSGVRTPK